VRDFLSKHDIPFVERNIRQDLHKEELLALTGKLSVPTIVVGGEWFIGYDPDRLLALIADDQVN
jgi:glutaredoxin 3